LDYSQTPVFEFLSQYAYQPGLIYGLIVVMMVASAFGLPLPEEITIISVAILAHMGAHPDRFPPPFPDAPVVNKWTASIITLAAVLISDIVVYQIGRKSGALLTTRPTFKRFFDHGKMQKVKKWTHDYGAWAVFFFRFMPGIRFPGHIFCGLMNLSFWKFILMDSFAALISIPTQLVFVATYGDEIIANIIKFKIYVFGFIAIVILALIMKKVFFWSVAKTDNV